MSFQCSSGTASRGNKSLRATGSINNDEIAARYRQPCRGFLKHIVLYKYTHECTLYITRNNKHVEDKDKNSELMLLLFNKNKNNELVFGGSKSFLYNLFVIL